MSRDSSREPGTGSRGWEETQAERSILCLQEGLVSSATAFPLQSPALGDNGFSRLLSALLFS